MTKEDEKKVDYVKVGALLTLLYSQDIAVLRHYNTVVRLYS